MLYQTINPHGGDVYSHPVRLDFSANINPYGTPEAVKAAVRESADRLFRYPDPACRELVHAIARQEQVPEDTILCGNGAAELIYAYALSRRPERALIAAPSFCEYADALRAAGCVPETYFLPESRDFRVDGEFCEFLARWQGNALFLCSPNNPTGLTISGEILEKILHICREKKLELFLDETFLDLTDSGVSAKPWLSAYPGLVLLKAFTKSFGMAGVRLGYCLCGNPELLQAMSRVSQLWNVSLPAQAAGLAALGCDDFRKKALEVIRQQRPVLTRGLKKLGFRVIPSETNFILFESPRELKAPLLEQGIQIRDCSNYPGLRRGWYRIAVKLPEENQVLLAAMEKILEFE